MPKRKDTPSASGRPPQGDVAPPPYPAVSAYFKKCQDRLNACAKVFGVKGQEAYVDAFAAKRPVLRVFESYYADLTNDHHPESIESVIAIARVREHAAAEALESDDADALALRMAMFASMVGFLSALERKKQEHDSHSRVVEGAKNRKLVQLKVRFQQWLRERVASGTRFSTIDDVLEQPDIPGGRGAYANKDTARDWYVEIFPRTLTPGRPKK